jgi:hypothetical protein
MPDFRHAFLYTSFYSSIIFRTIISKRIRWAWNAVLMVEKLDLVGKSEGNKSLGVDGRIILKGILRK